jgi:hypothetical protein
MAGLVAADASLSESADLGGRRVGGPPGGRLLTEYRACLARHGIADPVEVTCAYDDAPAALARGDIDVVPDFADLLPRVRRQARIEVRAVRIGVDVYATGLVAGDHVPAERVARMRAAVAAAVERQRQAPMTGLDALRRRYPAVDPDEAVEGWSLAQPAIFTGVPVGTMEPQRWRTTLAHYAAGHGLHVPDPVAVFRAEFATEAGRAPVGRATADR